MSILSRPKISPQQRFDLEDLESLLSALRTDSLLWSKQFLSDRNLILKGFAVSGIGLNSATVSMTDATLLLTQTTVDFSYFIAEPGAADITIPDSDLTDNTRNFVEIELCTEDNTPLTKAFWDPEANSGLGAEFNQIVNTMTDLKVNLVVSTAGFTGLPDRVPLAIIDTDNSGQIKVILDRREMFGRLSKPNDLANEYVWGTKEEPVYSLNMTGVAGTFTAGETITIGGETAEVVTGGGASITFKEPTGVNFFTGNSVTGGSSGATGTVDSVLETFTGVDKSLDSIEVIIKAIMTEIKRLKGTSFWYEDASASINSIVSFVDSQLVQAIAGAKFAWDGTSLEITDSNLNPADADVLGYLRRWGKSTDISLTRQSTGQETQLITFSSIPDSGSLTLNQNGDISNAINPGDNAAAVQAACNANWTNTVTVTGDFANGFTFKFDTAGPQVAITENSNTLVTGATPVTSTITTVQNGYAGGSAITIPSGSVMFIDVPATGDRTYDGIGAANTNYQVVDRASYVSSSEHYWIAYNEGGTLYVRGAGELQAGDDSPISDPDKESLLALIAANTTRDNQDRSTKLVEGGTWNLVDNAGSYELTLSADAYIQMAGLSITRNTVSAQTITLPNASSVAYVSVVRTDGVPNMLTVNVTDNASIVNTDDTFVIARRTSAGVLVGNNSFLLKPTEYLELDGALAEINRLLGQLRIRPHESDLDKVRISTAEIAQLDGTTLQQIIGNFMLKFDGAVIELDTGSIFESDGTTPLGTNFVPATIPVGEYHWYGISLLPGALNAINQQLATVQVDIGEASNAVQASAPIPVISGTIKLGWVQVQNNAGNIERVDINRLGVGSGSGSGGAGGSARDAYEDRLNCSIFESVSATAFEEDQDTFIDPSSTGSNSPADDNHFKFSAIGETLIDLNNAVSGRFAASGKDIGKTELYVRWREGAIDESATYEVSRDGGNEYQAVTMERVGTDTNAYRGFHIFAEEAANQNLDTQTTPDADRELTDTGAGVSRAVPLTPATLRVLKEIDLDFTKTEAVAGNLDAGKYLIKLVRDDSGAPSTDVNDIISETPLLNISALASGSATETVDIPDTVRAAAEQVWIVIETDAAYKAAFVTGTDFLAIRVNSLAPTQVGASFDGTTWSATAGEGWTYLAKGREIDLRVRITAGTADTLIESYGIYYSEEAGITADSGEFDIDLFEFSGDDNRTEFQLVNIQNPIPGLVEVFDLTRGQVYLDDQSTFSINGQTVTFIADHFNYPGETIRVKIRQLKAGVIDNSDTNAQAIASINQQLLDIGDQLESVSDSMVLARIAAPFTSIQNRRLMVDLASDLMPRFGINRVPMQQIREIRDERVLSGDKVYGFVNDKFDQARFAGNWDSLLTTNGIRLRALPNSTDSFFEYTFYGTGLNILMSTNIDRDIRASVDGGAEGGNILPATWSSVLGSRTYNVNAPVEVVSGLPLGIHTVKIRQGSATQDFSFYGVEVINDHSEIQLPPGAQLFKGRRLTNPVFSTTPYNSDFETGTLGTRGGHVLIYQKTDGTMGKAVTPTDSSAQYLSATDHANEEIIRTFNFREFGAGRSDDFSRLPADNADRDLTFTMPDGSTTLVGNNVDQPSGGFELLRMPTNGTFITLTFTGTGLDIIRPFINNTDQFSGVVELFVDGASQGIIPSQNRDGSNLKIVSGLPYGTHTVKLLNTAAPAASVHILGFNIYGPKTPTLPAGAKAVADYFITADADASTATSDVLTVPQGYVSKYTFREIVYEGTGWAVSAVDPSLRQNNGVGVFSATNGDSLTYYFYGDAISYQSIGSGGGTSDFLVEIDGVATAGGNNLVNVTDLGGGSYRSAVGNVITRVNFDLPLGFHEIKITKQSAINWALDALHIKMPIHSPDLVGPKVINNEFDIGSQSIRDLRRFSKKDVRQRLKSGRATLEANYEVDTVGVDYASGLGQALYLEEDTTVELRCKALLNKRNSSFIAGRTKLYLNGIFVPESQIAWRGPGTTFDAFTTGESTIRLELSKGFHFINLQVDFDGLYRINENTTFIEISEVE